MTSPQDKFLSLMSRLFEMDQECLLTFKNGEYEPTARWGKIPAPNGNHEILDEAKTLSADICRLNFDGSETPRFPDGANTAHMIMDPSSESVFFILEGDDFYEETWLSSDGLFENAPEAP